MTTLYSLIVLLLIISGLALAFYIYKRRGGVAKKQCGYCRSMVRYNALYCPKCGYEFIIG